MILIFELYIISYRIFGFTYQEIPNVENIVDVYDLLVITYELYFANNRTMKLLVKEFILETTVIVHVAKLIRQCYASLRRTQWEHSSGFSYFNL